MGNHSVIRPNATTLNRPSPQQRFKCFNHAKDRCSLKGLHSLHHLRNSRNKTQVHTAGTKDLCGIRYHLPGLRKIQDETIEGQTIVEQTDSLVYVPTKRDEIRHRAHVSFDIYHRRSRKILTVSY